MTTAERIIDPRFQRTRKECRDMADMLMTGIRWPAPDLGEWTFQDGSILLATFDCDLIPIEMVAI